MTRKLTDSEIEWLEGFPTGHTHSVTGNDGLAACNDCSWYAQGEGLEYLMEQVDDHLDTTYQPISPSESRKMRERFQEEFHWDPWAEGAIKPDHGHLYDILLVTERDESGEIVDETHMYKDMGEVDGPIYVAGSDYGEDWDHDCEAEGCDTLHNPEEEEENEEGD
jgi:hypothetical protein